MDQALSSAIVETDKDRKGPANHVLSVEVLTTAFESFMKSNVLQNGSQAEHSSSIGSAIEQAIRKHKSAPPSFEL